MTNYQQIPTFYRVTWTNNSPTDYTSAGGVSPLNSVQLHNTVAITNSNASPSFGNGDSILCNDVLVGPFSNVYTISNVVTAFNNVTQFTGVMASESFQGYLTLQSIDPPGQMIALTNASGTPLEGLGFASAAGFTLSNPSYGSAFSSLSANANVTVNGINVNFTGTDVSNVIANFNQASYATNIVALPCGSNIQLNSLDGSPIYFDQGSSGASVAIGFADNTAYAGAMTYNLAVAIEEANMLWKGMINSVESIVSPIYWDSIALSGSNTTDGSSIPPIVSWTIGITDPAALVTATLAGEPEAIGTLLYGIAALTRLLARGLVNSYQENRKLYNNTVTLRGGYACRENPVNIVYMTASALDVPANIHNIEGNFTVSMIGNA
jgi:hypothetical protein